MKRTTVFILSLILCISTGFAQKKDKVGGGRISLMQYPEEPLADSISTYSCNIESAYDDDYRRDDLRNNFIFEGFEKLEDGSSSDLVVFIKEYPTKNNDSSKETVTSKVKKDGVERTVYSYFYKGSFRYKYIIKVKYPDGSILMEKTYDTNQTVSSSQFSSSSKAYTNYLSNLKKAKAEMPAKIMKSFCKTLNSKHGFPYLSSWVNIFKIKAKKYKYDEFNASTDELVTILKSYDKGEDLASVEASLLAMIPVYEKDIAEFQDSRKARMNPKATAAAYYDVAIIYVLLGNYDKAIDAFDAAMIKDKGIGAGSAWKKSLLRLKTRRENYNNAIVVEKI